MYKNHLLDLFSYNKNKDIIYCTFYLFIICKKIHVNSVAKTKATAATIASAISYVAFFSTFLCNIVNSDIFVLLSSNLKKKIEIFFYCTFLLFFIVVNHT